MVVVGGCYAWPRTCGSWPFASSTCPRPADRSAAAYDVPLTLILAAVIGWRKRRMIDHSAVKIRGALTTTWRVAVSGYLPEGGVRQV